MTDLSELLARIEQATGPDRELDAAIEIAIERPGWIAWKEGWIAENERFFRLGMPKFMTRSCTIAKRYTASVDAALALVERVLPDWSSVTIDVPIGRVKVSRPSASLWDANNEASDETHQREAQTAPLALLAALLRARNHQVGIGVREVAPKQLS